MASRIASIINWVIPNASAANRPHQAVRERKPFINNPRTANRGRWNMKESFRGTDWRDDPRRGTRLGPREHASRVSKDNKRQKLLVWQNKTDYNSLADRRPDHLE